MVLKRPQSDSFIMPLRETVELETKYHSSGPAVVKLKVNGDLEHADSLPPSHTAATIDFSPVGPGEYSVQLVVEATPKDELQKLRQGKISRPENEEVANESWNITVAERNALTRANVEEFKYGVADDGLIYTIGDICFSVYTNWRMIIEDMILLLQGAETASSEETQATEHEFHGSYSEDDDD